LKTEHEMINKSVFLSSGFSAEISVFVQTGDSVQLDIQTQKLPEFYTLSWTNDKSEIIVVYIPGTKVVIPHPSYKDRVYFNDETFSLTLKNIQKTDSGLYTAKTRGESDETIATYRVSVIGESHFIVFLYKRQFIRVMFNFSLLYSVQIYFYSNILNKKYRSM